MSFEVVYTSAPRGLLEGASGFCTVASTKGIPRALLKKLETLSGYHHIGPAGSENNPVNYAHCTVRVQNKVYHVLSRIADAGPDHTGRSNKIAHHLAIPADVAKGVRGGPLALFGDRRFWFKEWDREPTQLPPNRMPKPTAVRVDDFESWEAVFGDAGFAGLLGESAKEQPKPVCVIVPSAEDSLKLLTEAMQLVSPSRLWKVGFSTYYAQATGDACHWRFAPDGTDAARKMRGRSAALLLDHKAPRSLPRGNPFVEAARSGDASRIQKSAKPAAKSSSRTTRRKPAPMKASRDPGSSVTDGSGEDRRGSASRRGGRRLRPSELRRQQRAQRRHRQVVDDDWDEEDVHEVDFDNLDEGANRKIQPLWIAVGAVTLLVVLGLLAYQFWWKPDNTAETQNTDTVGAVEQI